MTPPSGARARRRTDIIRDQLLSVVTELWFDIDHHNGANAHRFFTADAELRFSEATFKGTEQIVTVYADRAARGPRVSRHIVTNLHLLDVQRTRVRATSILLLFGDDGAAPRPRTAPALIGDVVDEFTLQGGRWLISSRWIKHLFIEPATELAVPNR